MRFTQKYIISELNRRYQTLKIEKAYFHIACCLETMMLPKNQMKNQEHFLKRFDKKIWTH